MNALFRGQKYVLKSNYYSSYSENTQKYIQTCFSTRKSEKLKLIRQHSIERNKLICKNWVVLSSPLTHLLRSPILYNESSNWNNKDGYHDQRRYFSISSRLYDQPSSKVEASVQTLKKKQKEQVEEQLKKDISQMLSTSDEPEVLDIPKPVVVKKSLKQKVWEEILHYYHGFRLLFIDINICRKLLWRLLTGNKLTRRENRLLVRTTSDLFRLVPFSVFIIIPFMELLLPVFIKFFPGMLPSTFQTTQDREDKLKQNLTVKLEMAKFLQKTLDEMALQHKTDHKSEEAKQFAEFFSKIKDPNEHVSSDDIIKFAKSFEDEVTLDALSREQLLALCRILELNTLGTTNFLRFHLRMKLRNLAADDKMIAREGVDGLNLFELQQACKSRGMRAYGLSKDRLESQLQEWIDLSLNEKVPQSLILLSRALMVPDNLPTSDKLKDTIRSLPDTLAAQTKAAIGELEGKVDNKTKIEVIKEEVRKIKEEREEEHQEEKEKAREQAEVLVDRAPVIELDAVSGNRYQQKLKRPQQVAADEPGTITSEDVELLSEALVKVSNDKKQMLMEKETIKELKEEIEDYKEDVEELREINTAGTKPEVKESRAAKILFKKVNSMIGNLDKALTDLEKKDGASTAVKVEEEADKETTTEETVSVDDLVNAIKMIKKVSPDTRLHGIESVLSKIDADKDGHIKVDDVMKVVETVGKDNVKLNERQIEEIVELLEKEESLVAEDKIEKALAKSIKEASKQNSTVPAQESGPIGGGISQEIDEKHIIVKKMETNNIPPAIKQEIGIQAVEKQQEQILPKTGDVPPSIPTPQQIPPIPSTTIPQQNSKDKML